MMTVQAKIQQLRSLIRETLTPLINHDYWLLEVPYYTNIGDSVIWQGELDFLKSIAYTCKGMYSLESFQFPAIDSDDLIVFQGGGNFGDIWQKHHDFKMKVVECYPNNRFVFLPQTVCFQNEENIHKCAVFLSHYDVVICARDEVSYTLLQNHFSNTIKMVPDMGFYMNMDGWKARNTGEKPLLLKRTDIEFQKSLNLSQIEAMDVDISDWPTMNNEGLLTRIMYKCKKRTLRTHFPWMMDVFCAYVYRPYLIRAGIRLLSVHSHIYSTRLHGAILALLLDKKVTLLDNSYGKNSWFYHTWLSDCDDIDFVD